MPGDLRPGLRRPRATGKAARIERMLRDLPASSRNVCASIVYEAEPMDDSEYPERMARAEAEALRQRVVAR